MKKLDLTGRVVGKLTVLGIDGSATYAHTYWLCQCVCGNVATIRGTLLKSGKQTSCGCTKFEDLRKSVFKHGMSCHPLYGTWSQMMTRCYNSKHRAYDDYGSRGITVCERWKDVAAFVEDMGEKPSPKHSIDRIDSNGNYEPSNCRWSTRKEQANNTRRNVIVEYAGKPMTAAQLCELLGIKYKKFLYYFNRRKLSLEDSIEACQ